MQIVLPIEIKNGFDVDYICSACGSHVQQTYYWLSFPSISKNPAMPIILCQFCKAEIQLNLTNISRPFKTSAFTCTLEIY